RRKRAFSAKKRAFSAEKRAFSERKQTFSARKRAFSARKHLFSGRNRALSRQDAVLWEHGRRDGGAAARRASAWRAAGRCGPLAGGAGRGRRRPGRRIEGCGFYHAAAGRPAGGVPRRTSRGIGLGRSARPAVERRAKERWRVDSKPFFGRRAELAAM